MRFRRKRTPKTVMNLTFGGDWKVLNYPEEEAPEENEVGMSFSTKRAERAKAQLEANLAAGPCPNCGAMADVDLIDMSWGSWSSWVAGEVHCSARCDETDPDAYLSALQRHSSATKETP